MSKALYESLYEEPYNSNVLLAQDNNLEEEKEEALAKELMENNEISSVSSNIICYKRLWTKQWNL